MTLKLISLIFVGSLLSLTTNAQKVKFKNEKVFIDDTEVLSWKKSSGLYEWHYYKVNTTDEVVFAAWIDINGNTFSRFYFPQYSTKVQTKSLYFGVNSRPAIEKLIEDGVIQKDGAVNEQKLKEFVDKYNDNLLR